MGADERADSKRDVLAVDMELVVVEAVLFVPQPGAAQVIHRVGDGDEVLEEFGGHVLVAGSSLASSSAIESMVVQ